MGWATGVAVYIVVWWVVLFAVLPWRVRPLRNPVPGADLGAPDHPHLLAKAAATTLVSAIVWLAIELTVRADLVSFR